MLLGNDIFDGMTADDRMFDEAWRLRMQQTD